MKKIYALAIVLLGVIIAAFFAWSNYFSEPLPIKDDNFSVVTEIAPEEEQVNWLHYVNDVVGYTFKYPPEFEVEDDGPGSAPNKQAVYASTRRADSPLPYLSFQIFYPDTFESEPIVVDSKETFIKEVRRRYESLNIREDTRLIGHETSFKGKPAIVEETLESGNVVGQTVYIWHGDRILIIDASLLVPGTDSLFSKIMSTFQFTDSRQ